ncbi:MAG: hypothetical protein V4597_03730 [Pseudomonadota bacterium]|uniref:hypothetical protein n=1 Tax=Phenylobacterium sp. TaxID=1871053 RepID=UPI00334B962C
MKLIVTIFGALLALLGGVWVLQGLNILPGSFMTGDIKWAIYGGIAVVVGLILIVWSRRRT